MEFFGVAFFALAFIAMSLNIILIIMVVYSWIKEYLPSVTVPNHIYIENITGTVRKNQDLDKEI